RRRPDLRPRRRRPGRGDGDQTFDLDGADLAARFLTDQGMALRPGHPQTPGDRPGHHYDLATRKRPEIALVTEGAGYDLGPDPAHPLPPGYADHIHAALPRLHAAAVIYDMIVDQALAKPHKAPPFSMPGELLRQKTGAPWPTWRQLMSDAAG
ncbi:hypothetical protein AB4Z54_65900, partial [Streptomyces sp. MCAF7]